MEHLSVASPGRIESYRYIASLGLEIVRETMRHEIRWGSSGASPAPELVRSTAAPIAIGGAILLPVDFGRTKIVSVTQQSILHTVL
jgi:hypothetical protein